MNNDQRPDDGPRERPDEDATFDPGDTPLRDAGHGPASEAGGYVHGDVVRETDAQGNTVLVHRAYDREGYEPSELSNPLPKWYSAMALGLVAWGAGYFYFQGATPADAGDHRSVLALATAGPVDGATVFAGNCVACHQSTGLGLAGAFPPLAGSGWVLAEPEVVGQILLHGIQGPIEVLGNAYDGVMPAFPQLSDAELAAVQNHIRSEWGNDAPAITAEWYAEQRALFPDDRGPWTGGEEIIEKVGAPVAVGGS